MAEVFKGLVTRDKKVAFMGLKADSGSKFTRMTNFTETTRTSNPNEYERKYVDESSSNTDIVGYSPSISYAFDQYIGNKVHEEIVAITEEEKTGDEAIRDIIIVDFTQPVDLAEGQFYARKRSYSVIPDEDGGDENVYTYTGNFKSKSDNEKVKVQTSDGWKTCTIVSE